MAKRKDSPILLFVYIVLAQLTFVLGKIEDEPGRFPYRKIKLIFALSTLPTPTHSLVLAKDLG